MSERKKHPPKAAVDRRDEPKRDPWKRLREKPEVRILDHARSPKRL